MENFKKIQKPNNKPQAIEIPVKVVNIPTYDVLSKSALVKEKYLSEFKTDQDKQKARDNLGIINSFKVVGEYETLEQLKYEVPIGNENEAYLIGSDIYTWSNSLKDWFKYGASGSSAYDIAVANGFQGSEEEWLASLGQANLKVLHDLNECDPANLFTLFSQSLNYTKYVGTIDGAEYPLTVSRIPLGFLITFTSENRQHMITIVKEGSDYISEWNYIELYSNA